MPRLPLRFNDLKARGIVCSRQQLQDRIDNHDFPAGRMMGPNTRIWFEDEVDAWLESRPSALEAKPPLRGGAKRNRNARERAEA